MPTITIDNAISLVGELDISEGADDLNLPDIPGLSSLPYFTGVDVVLRNNIVNVLTISLSKSKFNFIDTSSARRRHIQCSRPHDHVEVAHFMNERVR